MLGSYHVYLSEFGFLPSCVGEIALTQYFKGVVDVSSSYTGILLSEVGVASLSCGYSSSGADMANEGRMRRLEENLTTVVRLIYLLEGA